MGEHRGAVVTIAYVAGGTSAYPHGIFFTAIEVACALVIIRYAWRWRETDSSTIPAVEVAVER